MAERQCENCYQVFNTFCEELCICIRCNLKGEVIDHLENRLNSWGLHVYIDTDDDGKYIFFI